MEYAKGQALFLQSMRGLCVPPQARRARSFRRQRFLSRGFRSRLGAGAGDRGRQHVRGGPGRPRGMARTAGERPGAAMNLAILEAGAPPPALEERFGRYPAMFEALLGLGARSYDVQAG